MAFRLQFEDLAGNVLHSSILTEGGITVGRSGDCDVALASSSVSREHARFFIHLGRPYVEDLRSANGVVVNGVRVRGMQALNGPTVVVIGDHIVRFAPDGVVLEDGATPPTVSGLANLVQLGPNPVGPRTRRLPDLARVGRASTADVQLADQSVSRLHAELRTEGPSTIVSDMGSANGTFVNGMHVSHPTALVEGDVVQFGDLPFVFTSDPTAIDWRTVEVPAPGQVEPESTRLLLVAAGLAAAVILCAVFVFVSANRDREDGEEPLDIAAEALNTGDWAAAVAAYEAALQEQPDSQAIISSLDRARRELSAAQSFEACASHLEAARRLQTGADTPSAIAAFDTARTCFAAVDDGSSAGADAERSLRDEVVPPLVELHRDAGARALTANRYDDALEHLRTAQRLEQERNPQAASNERVVTNELRGAYIRAAEAALDSEQWARADSLLSQAHEISPLDRELADKQQSARANAARSR